MSTIYVPNGKAREYSPLAVNLYTGCNHGCKYCYAPSIRRMDRSKYLSPEPRRNILQELEKDCKRYYGTDKNVQFCFMTDPYNSRESELRITREALKMCLKYKIPVSILTKSKTVLNDIDVIKKFGEHIKVGLTLTFNNDKDSLEWEPEASLPDDRIKALKTLKEKNVTTWASFEPVIKPKQSLNLIEKSLNYVDIYKVGKLNNFKGLDKEIDWTSFLNSVVNILRSYKKAFYVKHDLRLAASSIKLYGNETNMDEFNLNSFM
jgi:DNA repair photolyase